MAEIWIPRERSVDALVDDYSDAQHERHAHGLVIVDGKEVATTLMCDHCGGHFVSRKRSGHRRQFCLKCGTVTCGKPACHPDFYHGVLKRVHFELD